KWQKRIATLFLFKSIKIDDFNLWHLHLESAVGESVEVIFFVENIFPRFETGCRCPKKDGNFFEMGAHDRSVARIVAKCFVLFVGRLMLLVDDNEAEVRNGTEEGGASSNKNTLFSLN